MSKMSFLYFISLFMIILPKCVWGITCTVTTPSLVFPNYDTTQHSATTTAGTVSVTCDKNSQIDYTIAMSSGNAGAYNSFNPRHLSLNGAGIAPALSYNLYYNNYPPAGTIWGDGTGGSHILTVSNAHCRNAPCLSTVYGSIPGSQNVPSGLYRANIAIQLNY